MSSIMGPRLPPMPPNPPPNPPSLLRLFISAVRLFPTFHLFLLPCSLHNLAHFLGQGVPSVDPAVLLLSVVVGLHVLTVHNICDAKVLEVHVLYDHEERRHFLQVEDTG